MAEDEIISLSISRSGSNSKVSRFSHTGLFGDYYVPGAVSLRSFKSDNNSNAIFDNVSRTDRYSSGEH